MHAYYFLLFLIYNTVWGTLPSTFYLLLLFQWDGLTLAWFVLRVSFLFYSRYWERIISAYIMCECVWVCVWFHSYVWSISMGFVAYLEEGQRVIVENMLW